LFTSTGLAEGSNWFWREASLAIALQVGPVYSTLGDSMAFGSSLRKTGGR